MVQEDLKVEMLALIDHALHNFVLLTPPSLVNRV